MTSNSNLMELAGFLEYVESQLGWEFNTDEFDDRFLLQKYVFFAQKLGLDTDYEYNIYVFGAYSPALARDYYSEVSSEKGFAKRGGASIDEDRFLRIIRNRDSRWLEIASTLVLYYERYDHLPSDRREAKSIEKTMDEKEATEKTVSSIYRTLLEEGLML